VYISLCQATSLKDTVWPVYCCCQFAMTVLSQSLGLWCNVSGR
jgi:hypothetical protein